MFSRAARANSRHVMLLTLALVMLAAAGGIYLWQSRGERIPAGPSTTLECGACKQRFDMTPAQFERALAALPQSGPGASMAKLRCKLCGAREAVQVSTPPIPQGGGMP